MSAKLERIYTPFGNLIFHITGNEPSEEIFKVLWQVSTHFAVVNSNVPFMTGINDGKSKKKKFKGAFDSFPVLTKLMTNMWWVEEWPGTYSFKPDKLLVFGKTSAREYDNFFCFSDNIFWHGPDSWDDLMLFVDNKLLFYSCTHEEFGSIIGNKELFFRMRLSKTTPCLNKTWLIKGYSIPIELLQQV
jgi:hypothetical protein